MALLDIDRHILSQIANLQMKIKLLSTEHSKHWDNVTEAMNKIDAVLFSSECSINPEQKKYLKKLRSKLLTASTKCQKCFSSIVGAVHKQEALYMHLVSLVEKVDTEKGQETKET